MDRDQTKEKGSRRRARGIWGSDLEQGRRRGKIWKEKDGRRRSFEMVTLTGGFRSL